MCERERDRVFVCEIERERERVKCVIKKNDHRECFNTNITLRGKRS